MQAGLTPPGQTTASRGSAPSGAVPCPPPSPPGREWKPDPALSFSFPGRIAITEAPCAPARLGTGAHAARSFSKRFPPKRPVLRAKLGVWERRVSERRPRGPASRLWSAHDRQPCGSLTSTCDAGKSLEPNHAARTRSHLPSIPIHHLISHAHFIRFLFFFFKPGWNLTWQHIPIHPLTATHSSPSSHSPPAPHSLSF